MNSLVKDKLKNKMELWKSKEGEVVKEGVRGIMRIVILIGIKY